MYDLGALASSILIQRFVLQVFFLANLFFQKYFFALKLARWRWLLFKVGAINDF